ncbi:hypothetical protein E3N88_06957 [Mikania micrantha]|uniref:Uncharacterized protein n=1 Tax=Mikania micrantha TaxID=192012 RepID=A0A5N6PQX1_9ASTR|nr:hypothetical protein E3N88_06957 [Mikania micrantha]
MEKISSSPQDVEIRKGPWTMEEDLILINYIADHGEGVWNTLAKSAGLKRTGKSCRLRWLNYLRPDVRRGNITTEEQLLIMELHAKWGNRWSKIAKHLPGRTDNEIKNYWRTKIQKHMKQTNSFYEQTSSGHTSQMNMIPPQACNGGNPMELSYYPPCENTTNFSTSFATAINENTSRLNDTSTTMVNQCSMHLLALGYTSMWLFVVAFTQQHFAALVSLRW